MKLITGVMRGLGALEVSENIKGAFVADEGLLLEDVGRLEKKRVVVMLESDYEREFSTESVQDAAGQPNSISLTDMDVPELMDVLDDYEGQINRLQGQAQGIRGMIKGKFIEAAKSLPSKAPAMTLFGSGYSESLKDSIGNAHDYTADRLPSPKDEVTE